MLFVSGAFTWFNVYTTYEEQQEEKRSVKKHTERKIIMKESSVVLEELEAEELSEEFPQRLPGGITERHVKEWNIEDKRIGIDELMSLLAESKSN